MLRHIFWSICYEQIADFASRDWTRGSYPCEHLPSKSGHARILAIRFMCGRIDTTTFHEAGCCHGMYRQYPAMHAETLTLMLITQNCATGPLTAWDCVTRANASIDTASSIICDARTQVLG